MTYAPFEGITQILKPNDQILVDFDNHFMYFLSKN